MRAVMALVLHLGGVGECMRLIWEWSVHGQESGDLQTLGSLGILPFGIWLLLGSARLWAWLTCLRLGYWLSSLGLAIGWALCT